MTTTKGTKNIIYKILLRRRAQHSSRHRHRLGLGPLLCIENAYEGLSSNPLDLGEMPYPKPTEDPIYRKREEKLDLELSRPEKQVQCFESDLAEDRYIMTQKTDGCFMC